MKKMIVFVAITAMIMTAGLISISSSAFKKEEVFRGIDTNTTNSDIGAKGGQLSDSDPLKRALNTAFTWAGIIAVILIMVSGLFYVLAGGDSSKIGRAKNMLMYTIIGLIIIVMSGAIVSFVVGGIF